MRVHVIYLRHSSSQDQDLSNTTNSTCTLHPFQSYRQIEKQTTEEISFMPDDL